MDTKSLPRRRSSERPPRIALLTWAGAALLTLLVYLPLAGHAFLNWDDPQYVVDNPHIRSLDVGLVAWAFTSFHALNWHPLTWLSHALDWQLWGADPRGHHLGNIVLHAANTLLAAVLVWSLCRLSGSATPKSRRSPSVPAFGEPFLLASGVAALLFGLHPLHVESVAWVSERKDVLSAFFCLLSLNLYVRRTGPARRPIYLVASLLSFALALLSKPMAVSLPLVLLILDVFPLRRIPGPGWRPALLEKLPFAALAAGAAVLTVLAQAQGGAMGTLQAYPFSTRLLVAVRAIGFYVLKAFVPVGLSPFYPYPKRVSAASLEYLAASALVLAVSAVCIHWWRRGAPALLAAWASQMVLLLPVLGLVHFGPQAAADRYSYLALLPAFCLAGVGVERLVERARMRGFAVPAVFILALLAILTVRQEGYWRDSVTLWNRVLALYPDSELAYNRRGDAWLERGRDDLALADLSRSIELAGGGFEPSLYRRARILLQAGRYDEALRDIRHAIALWPGRADAYNVSGACLTAMGQLDMAIDDFTRALDLDPNAPQVYVNRGGALRSRGDLQRALRDFDRALELDGANAGAYHGRAMVLAARGERERALADLDRAVELGGTAQALFSRCELNRALGRYDTALADCTRGLALDRRSAPGYTLRGLILLRLRRHAEARADLDRAVGLAPRDADARLARGTLLGELGRAREALADLDWAIRLDPASGNAHFNRAVARRAAGDRAGALEDLRAAARLGDEDLRRLVEKLTPVEPKPHKP